MMMSPLVRYSLIQIPGWIILAGLLWWAVRFDWIAFTTAAGIMALWLLKDAALYPLCRPAFEHGPATGSQALIGQEATVIRPLDPQGQVRLNGELWSARSGDDAPINCGEVVRVRDTEGLVLIVQCVGRPP